MLRTLFHAMYVTALIFGCAVGVQVNGQSAGSDGRTTAQVYVIPFSHLDFFWGGTREECLARGNRIIAKAIELAARRPEFRFLVEDDDFVANYVESHAGSRELADLQRLVKEGRIEIAPKWAAIFQNLPSGEVLSRNLVYGKRYARATFGVDPQVAHLGDIPGFTPQFPQMLRQAAIPYMVMTRMGPSDKSLFNWVSPDGSRVLVWSDLYGYGWGSSLGLHKDLDEARRSRVWSEVERVRHTTNGPIFMTWGVDLWVPTDKVIDNINALNRDSASGVRFTVGTPTDFFARAAKTQGVPETSGEIPSAWPNVATSLLHMWQLAVPATNALLDAEKFSAINYALGYADYPQREMEFLWKKLIESMDHNHDGQGGSIGDDRKIGYSQMAILRGREIMRDMTRNIAERVQIPFPGSFPIVVFNSQGWLRSDIVKAHVTLYGDVSPGDIPEFKKGMRLTDEKGTPVPFQIQEYSENISRALDLVFVAKDVPPLGYKTFYLAAAAQPDSFPKASEISLDSERDFIEPRRPLGIDTMENAFYRVSVDKATGRVALFDKALKRDVCKDMEVAAVEERGGNNVAAEELTGRVIPNSINKVELEENNAVRTVMRVVGQVADVPVVQRLTLYQGLKRLDIENRIEWKGPRFVRLQQLFPIPPEARVHYGVPFAAQAADNIIPGSEPHQKDELQKAAWVKYRQIQDWVSADTAGACLTIAVDHQLIRLDDGLIRGEMIRGLRFTSVRVVRGAEVTSLQYPPPGIYVFKYSLSSASGDWRAARSYESGMEFNSPLVPISVVDEISSKTLPPANSFCSLKGDGIVISTLKKSDVDPTVVLRVYEINGSSVEGPIEFLGKSRMFREANLLEEGLGAAEERALRLNPYQIKTLKIPIER